MGCQSGKIFHRRLPCFCRSWSIPTLLIIYKTLRRRSKMIFIHILNRANINIHFLMIMHFCPKRGPLYYKIKLKPQQLRGDLLINMMMMKTWVVWFNLLPKNRVFLVIINLTLWWETVHHNSSIIHRNSTCCPCDDLMKYFL